MRRIVVLAVGLTVALGLAPAASAGEVGVRSCRASAVRVVGLPTGTFEPVVANSIGEPCQTESAGLDEVVLPGGLGTLEGLAVSTQQSGNIARAESTVARATLTITGLPVIDVVLLKAKASACHERHLRSGSRVVSLNIGGDVVVVPDGHAEIPLLAGTLHLNERIRVGDSVTRRAFFLETELGIDVIISEAMADF